MAGILTFERSSMNPRLNNGLLQENAVKNGGGLLLLTLVRSSGSWMAYKLGKEGINVPDWKQLMELSVRGDGGEYEASLMSLCCGREVKVDVQHAGKTEFYWSPLMASEEMPKRRLGLGDSLTVVVNPRMRGFRDIAVTFSCVDESLLKGMVGTRGPKVDQSNFLTQTKFKR